MHDSLMKENLFLEAGVPLKSLSALMTGAQQPREGKFVSGAGVPLILVEWALSGATAQQRQQQLGKIPSAGMSTGKTGSIAAECSKILHVFWFCPFVVHA